MDNESRAVFKTPQKMAEIKPKSPSLKFIHHRPRSPLSNIQMTTMVSSSQYTTGSPIKFLPQNHCSPPAPSAYFKIRNPFERTLVESLNTPMCSPGMFKIRESSGSFKWDIEHVSLLKPANIVACNSQFDPSPDPILEKKAVEAIEKFFSQEMIVPSPLDQPPKRNKLVPTNSQYENPTTPESSSKVLFREASAQTVLTFPSDLPPEIENVLKPFYTYTKESNNGDADVSANASLRRKLCFEATFSDGEEELPPNEDLSSPLNYEVMQSLRTADLFAALQSSHQSKIDYIELTEHKRRRSPEEYDEHIYSPVIQKNFNSRFGNGESNDKQNVKSPSLSPIRQLTSSKVNDASPKSPATPLDYHHSCDASPFSQSTPEKSSLSKISAKSSPDISNTSDDHISHLNMIDQLGTHRACDMLNDSKKRSQSEISLNRARSAIKLDFNMDISSDSSVHFSVDPSTRCHSVLGISSDSSISTAPSSSNLLSMEMAQVSTCSICCVEKTNRLHFQSERCDSIMGVCDKCAIVNNQGHDGLADVYQFVTPTKSYRNALRDVIKNKQSDKVSNYSPMQMSLDNSFSLDTNRNPQDFCQVSIQAAAATAGNMYSVKNDKNYFSSTLCNEEARDKNETSFSLQRTDSGFNDNFNYDKRIHNGDILSECDLTMCNTPRMHSNSDIAKSFNYHNELSSASWKRFDSGFNEETSDTLPQTSYCHDHIKQPKKYSPIVEYSEHEKENIYCHDFNKVSQPRPRVCDSMSISDILTDDMVSFNCNFSSTPSKNLFKKF